MSASRSAPNAAPHARPAAERRSGMTLIEIGIVVGIVSVLLALVMGLVRHVNEVVKIRRAQADLGEWHETLDRWFLQFGEYPYAALDANGSAQDLLESDSPASNLSNLLTHAYVQFSDGNTLSNITFRSFVTHGARHIDPWGSPYLYDCDPSRKTFTLFSCGPDSRTRWLDSGAEIDALDDIHLER